MKFKSRFIIIWITAASLLIACVNWRITLPVNDQGLFMVKDEAGFPMRLSLGVLLGGLYSAANVGLFILFDPRSAAANKKGMGKESKSSADFPHETK